MANIQKQIETIEANATSSGIVLPPGASEAAVASAERALGATLPEEVRAFYRAHDGGGEERHCGGHRLLSLNGMVAAWQSWKERLDAGELEEDEDDEPSNDEDDVRDAAWTPGWIPVTTDDEGNYLLVDLSPGATGRVGQIISLWDESPMRLVEGPSFLGWLSEVAWYDASMAPGAGDDEDDEDAPTFDDARAVFARFDAAGTGVVPRSRLGEILTALGTGEQLAQAEEVIDYVKRSSFDGPGVDELSWAELEAWLKSDKPA